MDFVGENGNDKFDLSTFDMDIEDTEAYDPFAPIANGNYTCRVDKIYVCVSQPGNPMVTWELVIVGDPFNNRQVRYRSMLTSAEKLAEFKYAVEKICDVTLTGTWANLFKPWTENKEQPVQLAQLLDIHLQINVKSQVDSDYPPNVRLLKRVSTPKDTPKDGDEIPF